MAVKLVVIYPRRKDVEAFETVYNRDHVPTAVEKLAGKTKIVANSGYSVLRRANLPSIASLRFISLRWRPSNASGAATQTAVVHEIQVMAKIRIHSPVDSC